jgi:hypothetical protein
MTLTGMELFFWMSMWIGKRKAGRPGFQVGCLWSRSATFDNKNVSYSDLSYRQQIQWMPKEWEKLGGDLFGQLSLRKIRSYQETSIESGFNVQIKSGKLTLSDESRFCYVFHDDSLIQDFMFVISIRCWLRDLILPKNLNLCSACLGWARKDDPYSKDKPVKPDSSFYVQLNPGFQWRPFDRGWAEASYLFSFVPLPVNWITG